MILNSNTMTGVVICTRFDSIIKEWGLKDLFHIIVYPCAKTGLDAIGYQTSI